MKNFDKYKKIVATVALFAVLLPSFSFVLLSPKKARAIVPTFDGANFSVNSLTADNTFMTSAAVSGLAFKDVGYIPGMNPVGVQAAGNGASCATFDCIVYLIMKQLIRAILQSIIQWVKTGFNGQPVFITDFERFFKDAALNASGIYLEHYLDPNIYTLLCEPWRLPVYNQLKNIRIYSADYSNTETYPRCTLATVIDNVGGYGAYLDDFRNGGWDAWFSLVSTPTNMPTGLYLQTLSSMQGKSEDSVEKAKTETVTGQGFISLADCAENSPSGSFCEVFDIKSPGKWIENQIGQWTTTDLRSLEIADELDELISAFIGVMLNSLFTSLRDW